jgi:hypothetical protein
MNMEFDIRPVVNRLEVRIHIAIVPPRMSIWMINANSVVRQSPPIEERFPLWKIPKNRRLFCDESGLGRDDGEGEEGGLLLFVGVDGSGLGDDEPFTSTPAGDAPRSAGCREGSGVVGLELRES